jgi:hypothetical protein
MMGKINKEGSFYYKGELFKYKIVPREKLKTNPFGECILRDELLTAYGLDGSSQNFMVRSYSEPIVSQTVPDRFKDMVALHEILEVKGLTHGEIFPHELELAMERSCLVEYVEWITQQHSNLCLADWFLCTKRQEGKRMLREKYGIFEQRGDEFHEI